MFAEGTEEGAEAVKVASGWFLEHAWLIPILPAVAFFVIIFFGKKLKYKGAEVGMASMLGGLVLAAGAAYQWIGLYGGGAEEEKKEAIGGFGRSLRLLAGGGEEVAPVIKQLTWWESGSGKVSIGIGQHIDGLAITMLLLVTFISTLVQLYSTEYVRGDRRYTHFFASLTLFSAGMLTMVLAPNMVQLILGWEIMGLCSFMLIGHWWEEHANSRAALKAFFTVRVGDMGLLVGTGMLLAIFGTLDIATLSEKAVAGEFESKTALMWAAVALFIACIGKSGQFPLHTWLPDAMAGPTPVSSLLHSSTMVVAGVFLVARIYPVFKIGLDINAFGQTFNLVAVIGGITVLIAAGLAFVQNDIKKVLAYSTVSQLGYMMMGLGVGAWTAAVFHIFTHAFFKCCLFLCAGSISHTAAHHSFDMKKDMGGIWRKMPVTFGAWMISTLALCGIPFIGSGFFSKDEIIDSAKHYDYTIFYFVGIVGALMTTAYMTRATYLTFFGKPRGGAAHFMGVEETVMYDQVAIAGHDVHGHDAHGHDAGHDAHGHDAHGHGDHGHDDHAAAAHGRPLPFAPHDSPWQITVPLIILGFLACAAGYLNAPPLKWHKFETWTESSIFMTFGEKVNNVLPPPVFEWKAALPGLALVLLGFIVSLALSKALFGGATHKLQGLTQRNRLLRGGHKFLVNKYYLDHLYEKVIVRGVAHPISNAAYWVNQNVLDGIVNRVGIGGRKTGEWVYRNIDQRVVDGAVNGSGIAARGTGGALRPVQSGKVSQYGALLFSAAAVGALILVIVNS